MFKLRWYKQHLYSANYVMVLQYSTDNGETWNNVDTVEEE